MAGPTTRLPEDPAGEPRGAQLPLLTDEFVRLRPWRSDDAEPIVVACTDAETRRWLPLPDPYTIDDAHAYIRGSLDSPQSEAWTYCIADAATDVYLGSIALRLLASRSSVGDGEIGYLAHPAARGRGVMTAAVRVLVRHAFNPVAKGGGGLRRVHLSAAEGNEASRRVALKAGFQQVGRDRRSRHLPDGAVVDYLRFDLLAEEVGF